MKFVLRVSVLTLIYVSPLSAQVTGLSGWNICLDPGHSQTENMGIYGYSEAEKNLGVGLWLREILLTKTDIDTVYMTRTNDQEYVTLSQRSDYANRIGTVWFHSIHSDAGDPQYNSTLLLWGQYYNGNEKVPNGGKAMSDIMVDILTHGMRTNTRGSIGDCSFYTWSNWCQISGGPYLHVNRETNMPSELSEAGFHTNPKQNQLNMNTEWKRLEAKTFYWSLLEFHEIERPFVGTCVGIISDIETDTPINGAQVTLDGQTYTTDTYGSLFHNYTSDPDLLHNGFYYFENLSDDTLQMIVEAENYYGDTSQVIVADTFFTFKDVKLISTVPPYVVSSTPAQGDTNFPAWDYIIINFSRKMNKESVETTFVISPEVEGIIFWGIDYKKMVFYTDSLDFETNYTVTISGNAKDMYGHTFDGNVDGIGGDDFTLNFRTGPADMGPPDIVTIYPPQNGLDIELHPILNVTYDEQIDPSSITEDILNLERFLDRSKVPGTLEHYVVNDQSVLCFFPAEKLSPDEIYITRICPGLRDLFGNEASEWLSFSFRTVDFDYSILDIDNFESDVTSNWWTPQQSGSTEGIITDSTSRDANTDIINLLTGSTKSLEVKYGWDTGASSWLIRVYLGSGAPRNVLFDSDYIMQVYVFGDGSGNKFRFCVDDNVPIEVTGNHEVSPWYTIDWIGWKLISWDMTNDGTGTWIGNGNLDGTLRFDSFQLTYNPGSSVAGTVYFDDLRLVKNVSVGVEEQITSLLPSQFTLYQNYPNPFNPKTTIGYQLANGSNHVVLAIYDLLGRKLRTLVDKEQPAGEYLIQWDGKDDNGTNVASGIYLYKLSTDDFSETRRMLLVK
jgi:N-acetylmuramoyl-L-alanine amidase